MAALTTVPAELFDAVIEHLVLTIGIQRAILLRTVSKTFDAAIIEAICVRQVVAIDDPATSNLIYRLPARIRGKIIITRSRLPSAETESYLMAVRAVNRALDAAVDDLDSHLASVRHEAVASAVNITGESTDSKLDLLNLLSGAAATESMHVLQSLVERRDLDVNARTPFFPGALELAAAHGDTRMVRYLLQNGARLDSVCTAWLKYPDWTTQAYWNKRDEHERHSALTQSPRSALRAAVSGGHLNVVHLLLDDRHRLPLDSVEYLASIVTAAGIGRLDIIDALFRAIDKKISDFDGLGNEMLWRACRHNRQSVVEMLIDQGVDVNHWAPRARMFSSALQRAASFGHTDLVRFMLSREADIHLRTSRGGNDLPIMAAAHNGQAETVDLLLANGEDAGTALISAAHGGQIRMVRLLLDRFPGLPHCKSGLVGHEALERAANAGNLTVLTMLVEAGADINQCYCFDHGGKPWHVPMRMSKKLGWKWVVQHLRSLGAEETDEDLASEESVSGARGIRVSERTWEWVGKY
jgi:ankyrin repeat protein